MGSYLSHVIVPVSTVPPNLMLASRFAFASFILLQRNYLSVKLLSFLAILTQPLFTERSSHLFLGSLCFVSYITHRRSTIRVPISEQKVVVITGCDSGLGYSFALYCKQLGFTVIAGCLLEGGDGALQLKAMGVPVCQLDVTNYESVRRFQQFSEKFIQSHADYSLHALVNNAGIMIFGEFEWLTQDHVMNQVLVNMLGYFQVTASFLQLLRKHQGRVINITSHCADANLPGLSVYGATKAGVQSWSDGLRVEQAKYGVKVITFRPGSFVMQSNILSMQPRYAEAMKAAMSTEVMTFYHNYFDRYHSYLASLSSPKPITSISDDGLHRKFGNAMLEVYPEPHYCYGPVRYTVYYFLFKITPTWLRDYLVQKFISMPDWREGR